MREHISKIFVDFEMHPTDEEFHVGKNAIGEQIIEFGAVKLNADNEEIEAFTEYVEPKYFHDFSEPIHALTGITRDMLVGKRSFIEISEDFLKWCTKDGAFKIYSWSDVDSRQLRKETRFAFGNDCHKFDVLFDNWVDYQKEFSLIVGYKKQHSLSGACDFVGIDQLGQAHDALDDARNTARIYVICSKKEMPEKLKKISKLMNGGDDDKVTLGDLFDFNKVREGGTLKGVRNSKKPKKTRK